MRLDHACRSSLRALSPARLIALWVLGAVLMLGILPGSGRAEAAASYADDVAPRFSALVKAAPVTHQHPCKQGNTTAPAGSCAVSGFAAGLPSAGVEYAPPMTMITELGPRWYSTLAHQWQGLPPDRPPRS
jgi:hypothetical protein